MADSDLTCSGGFSIFSKTALEYFYCSTEHGPGFMTLYPGTLQCTSILTGFLFCVQRLKPLNTICLSLVELTHSIVQCQESCISIPAIP